MNIILNLLKITVLVFFLLNGSAMCAQLKGEDNDMTKFDIQAFQQHKKSDLWEKTLADGTAIRQSGSLKSGYLMVITNNKNPDSESSIFNLKAA